MADKTITYRLSADISSFTAKMAQAGASVKAAAGEMTGATKQGKAFRSGLETVGKAGLIVGSAAAAGLGAAVAVAANFDQAMSRVQAATGESAANMKRLRDAALEAGAKTVFSASEAADGIEALAKAGVKTQDILGGGLKGALSLAAAGEIDVGSAAEDAATAMSQFGLQGKDVPHIADLLAAAAGKAQGEVSDFAMALNQSGLVAHQTGLSINETVGALAAFASKGLLGSDAGTSLKTFLLSLSGNSAQAKNLMDQLGFSAYDANGKFIGLSKTAGELRDKFSKLTDEQRSRDFKQIFGTDAIRAANILYDDGARGIQNWINKTNDQGFAAKNAATKLDNLKGDLEGLKGSLETALIGTGEGAQTPLRNITQGLTDVVNAYNKLPQGAQSGVADALGLTAVAGIATFAFSKIIGGIANTRMAWKDLGLEGKASGLAMRGGLLIAGAGLLALGSKISQTSHALGTLTDVAGGAALGAALAPPGFQGWGAAVGGAIGLLKGLMDANKATAAEVKGLTGTLDDQTGAITKNTAEWALNSLQQRGILDTARQLGVPLSTIRGAIMGNAGDLGHLNDLMDIYRQRLADVGAAGVKNPMGSQAFKDVQSLQGVIDAVKGEAGAVKDSVRNKRELIAATNGLTLRQAKLVQEYKQTPKTIRTVLAQVGLDKAEKGLHRLRHEYGLTPTQIKTVIQQVGMKGALGLIDMLSNKYHLSPKQVQTVIKQIGMGKSQAEIGKLLSQYKLTPPEKHTVLNAINHASGVINAVRNDLNSLHDKNVNITTTHITKYSSITPGGSGGGGPIGHNLGGASGGLIRGPGTSTSDSIPAMLSDREYIVNAAAVSKYGVNMLHSINAMRYAQGGLVSGGSQSTAVLNGPVAISGRVGVDGMFTGQLVSASDVRAIATDVVNKERAHERRNPRPR